MKAERTTETRVVGQQHHVRTDVEVDQLKNNAFRSGNTEAEMGKEKAAALAKKKRLEAALQQNMQAFQKRTMQGGQSPEEGGSAATVSEKELQTAKAAGERSADYAIKQVGKKKRENALLNGRPEYRKQKYPKTGKTRASRTVKTPNAAKKAATGRRGTELLNQGRKKAGKEVAKKGAGAAAKKGMEVAASTNPYTGAAVAVTKVSSAVKSFISFDFLKKAEEGGVAALRNSSPAVTAIAVILVVVLSVAACLPALPTILMSSLEGEDTMPGKIGVNANASSAGYSHNIYNEPQCTWYCWGRVFEVYGVKMPRAGNGADWARNLSGVYKEYSVAEIAAHPEMAIGTVASIRGGATLLSKLYGHVIFIEKVEGGRIYFSDWGATYKRKGVSFPHTGSFMAGTASVAGGTIQGFIAPTKPAGG